jgi:hypothetical protein
LKHNKKAFKITAFLILCIAMLFITFNKNITFNFLGNIIMESKYNPEKGDSEWFLVKEPYFDKTSGKNLEIDVLKRSDGFTLTDIGLNRELQETFLVKGNFGEFKFKAYRTDQLIPGKHKTPKDSYVEFGGYDYVILDKYVIYAYLGDKDKFGKNLCLKYSKDIESALLHYPVRFPFYKNIPIKEVVFDIGNWDKPQYIHAKDL